MSIGIPLAGKQPLRREEAPILIDWTRRQKEAQEDVRQVHSERFTKFTARAIVTALVLFAAALASFPLAAQQQGPMPPAPRQADPPPSAPETKLPQKPAASRRPSSGITTQPPSTPVDQIIQRFAASEAEFKKERGNYTYVQTLLVQTIADYGRPDGEYRLTSEVLFTPAGKRYEKITHAPPPTLQRVSLSEQDLADLQNVQPFVLTTEELPKYDIKYVGRERVDELNTYVFDVAPKKIEKNQRYFEGRIWVDDQDLQIVKTYGKAVPDIRKGGNENLFPRFETYRENIEGHYWFPTYTRADDMLHFSNGDVHIRMTVHYADYKRFQVTIQIRTPTEVKPDNP